METNNEVFQIRKEGILKTWGSLRFRYAILILTAPLPSFFWTTLFQHIFGFPQILESVTAELIIGVLGFVLYLFSYILFLLLPVKGRSHRLYFWWSSAVMFFCAAFTRKGLDPLMWLVAFSAVYAQLYIILKGAGRYNHRPVDQAKMVWAQSSFRVFLHPGRRMMLAGFIAFLAVLPYLAWPMVCVAVAIFLIETRLVFKKRSNRIYKLDPYSEDVLRIQASGMPLDEYAKKFHLPQLILTEEGGIRWRGCTKTSLPCFVRLQSNTLGLNTPPCCHLHMLEMLHSFDDLLTSLGVAHWADSETLLGAVRHMGGLIPWETGCDIGMFIVDSPDKLIDENHEIVLAIRNHCEETGLTLLCPEPGHFQILYATTPSWPFAPEIFRNEVGRAVKLSITQYMTSTVGNSVLLKRPALLDDTPANIVPGDVAMPCSTIQLGGRHVSAPANPHDYLTCIFGKEWHKTEYTYFTSPFVRAKRREADEKWASKLS